MKIFSTILITTLIASLSLFSQVNVISLKGDVKVRKGMSEEWQILTPNTKLNLEDAILIGVKSSAIIEVDNQRKITLPEKSIIEIADLRRLSKDEILLKLAMDRILAVPQQERKNDLMPAPSAIIHGEKKSNQETTIKQSDLEIALNKLNGAKVLFGNNYYGTCALRIKETLRIFPSLPEVAEYKLIVALALEKEELYEEALNEFYSINSDELTPAQRSIVQNKIEKLKKKFKD